ncbi:MAG: response regulator transcription factor [Magnetococcales bacterium]|nr:response regulator transcription factor [Magnetococcales bacterium]
MIRIFIADDHAIIRDGLKEILSKEPGFIVTGEADNGLDAVRKLRSGNWDILLLDVSMPKMSGLDALKLVQRDYPEKRVLILTQHEDATLALRFLKAGASGYVTKQEAGDELVKAIRKVINGGKYVALKVTEMLVAEIGQNKERFPHSILSDREFSVLCRIAGGMSLSDIASELNVSANTVSTYRRRILDKMNLSNNTDLIRYAISNGLVD